MGRTKKLTNVKKEKAIQMFDGFFRTTLTYNDQLMLCHFRIEKGASIPLHHHVAVQIGYVVKGKVELLSENDKKEIAETGSSYLIESEDIHGAFALEDSEYIETFYPVRPEYYPDKD
jgi:quercetin dioxygenase-like cupin family protein